MRLTLIALINVFIEHKIVLPIPFITLRQKSVGVDNVSFKHNYCHLYLIMNEYYFTKLQVVLLSRVDEVFQNNLVLQKLMLFQC